MEPSNTLYVYDNIDPRGVVYINDSFFNAHSYIPDTEFSKRVLDEIDKAARVSKKSFKGRSDRKVYCS